MMEAAVLGILWILMTTNIFLSSATSNTTALDPNGDNVCKRIVRFEVTYSAYVKYQAVEYYQTCCGFSWPKCWKTCVKPRLVTREKEIPKIRHVNATKYECCYGHIQTGNNCSKAICENGCLYGDCVAPNYCLCNSGYTGKTCSEDVDECKVNNGGCQYVCVNNNGSFECACHPGYKLDNETQDCEDVNECSLLDHLCYCGKGLQNSTCQATCRNTIGSYNCQCSNGYKLKDSQICINLNECEESNGNCSDICYDVTGSYKCACPLGYILLSDNENCADIDECAISNGGCQQTCINEIGSFHCECYHGYTSDEDNRTCSDINECEAINHGCQICKNTPGSYFCACPKGFMLKDDNKTCTDENECDRVLTVDGEFVSKAGCGQQCINTNGSFLCFCNEGYQLSNDGKTCLDIDECSLYASLCDHMCINVAGSYVCRCRDGYILADDKVSCIGMQCEDLPSVLNGFATCLSGRTDDNCKFRCKNGFRLQGSSERFCQSNQKWNGSVSYCKRRKCPTLELPIFSRTNMPCYHYYDATCKVNCVDGYLLDGASVKTCSLAQNGTMFWTNNGATCQKSRACYPNPCKHSGTCSATAYTFHCDCYNTGYTGLTCEIGHITIGPIPILKKDAPQSGFFIQAKPDEEITVEILSETNLKVDPSRITFNKTRTSVELQVLGNISGIYELTFKLSGKQSNSFQAPPNAVVYVSGDETWIPDALLTTDGRISKGCSVEKKVEYTAYANSQWISNCSSNGIIQISGSDQVMLPMSISGGTLCNNSFDKYTLANGIRALVATSQNDKKDGCFAAVDPSKYIGYLLRSNAFLYSVLSVFNDHSPFWIKLMAPIEVDKIESQDIGGNIFAGTELITKRWKCTTGMNLEPRGLYYVYETNQLITAYLINANISLPTSLKKCFVKNLKTSHINFAVISNDKENTHLEIFSDSLKMFLNINGIIDRIGFAVNEINGNQIFSYGKKEIFINETLHSIHLQTIGLFKWKRHSKSGTMTITDKALLEVKNSNMVLNLKWKNRNSTQSLYIKGVSNSTTFDHKLHGESSNIIAVSTIIEKHEIHLSKGVTDIFNFDNKKPAIVKLVYSEIFKEFISPKHSLKSIEKQFIDSLTEQLLELNSLRFDASFLRKGKVGLVNLLQKTYFDISILTKSSSNNSSVRELAKLTTRIRTEFLDAQKRYKVLLDRYLESDSSDSIMLKNKYDNFQVLVSKIINSLPYFHLSINSKSQLIWCSIQGAGNICFKSICFDNATITFRIGSSLEVGHSGKTWIDALSSADLVIGNLLTISKRSSITLEMSATLTTISANFTGMITIYGNNKSVDIHVINSQLSTSTIIRFLKNDLVLINITASLSMTSSIDPIMFHVFGEFQTESKLLEDINEHLVAKLSKTQTIVNMRRTRMQQVIDRSKYIVKKKASQYYQQLLNLKSLEVRLMELNSNIAIVKEEFHQKREKFKNAAGEFEADMNLMRKHAKLLKDCKPLFCFPKCLPGLLGRICQSEIFTSRTTRNCSFVKEKVNTIKLALVKYDKNYTALQTKKTYKKVCPVLTEALNGRKRRGVITKLVAPIAGKIFQELGGKYAQKGAVIGAKVGGKILSFLGKEGEAVGAVLGAIIGGIIGSFFGPCQEICQVSFVPKTVNYSLFDYKPQRTELEIFKSICESVKSNVSVGYESKSCYKYTSCSNVLNDHNCTSQNDECATTLHSISQLSSDPTYQQSYEEFAKSSSHLQLLVKKRDILRQRVENIQKLVDLGESLLVQANRSYHRNIQSNLDFNKTFYGEIELARQFGFKKNTLQVDGIGFNYDMLSGRQFPNKIVIKLTYSNHMTSGNSANSLLDITNYVKGVHDATDILIKATLRKIGGKSRNRRALPTVTRRPDSLIEHKCSDFQLAYSYISNIAESLENLVYQYANDTEDLRHSKDTDIKAFINALRLQSKKGIQSSDSSELDTLVDNISGELQNQQKESNLPPWNETLEQFFENYHSRLNAQETSDCINFLDCLQQSLSTMANLLLYENNVIANYSLKAIQSWNDSIFTLYNELPDIKESKLLISLFRKSVLKSNSTVLYCGVAPELKMDLKGDIHVAEGDEINLKIKLLDTVHEAHIIWKKDNFIITGQNFTHMNFNATLQMTGYYTCEVENIFGQTHCGTVRVVIYTKPIFVAEPMDTTVFVHSTNTTYLMCNSTSNPSPKIQWYMKNLVTGDVMVLPDTGNALMLSNYTVNKTGLYYCVATNGFQTTRSRIAMVNVLGSTIGVKRIRNTLIVKSMEKIPNTLTQSDTDVILSNLEVAMNITRSSLKNLKYQKITSAEAEISFEIHGLNSTKELTHFNGNWETVSNKFIKEREDLFLRPVLLYYKTNKTTYTFDLKSARLIVQPKRIEVYEMSVLCGNAQVVLDNGYVCGDCPAGTKYDKMKKKCVACEKDTYNPFPRQTTCVSCPRNTYTDENKCVSHFQCKPATTRRRPIIETTKGPKPCCPNPMVGIAIGITLGFVALILIIIVVVYFYNRIPGPVDVWKNPNGDDEMEMVRKNKTTSNMPLSIFKPNKTSYETFENEPMDNGDLLF